VDDFPPTPTSSEFLRVSIYKNRYVIAFLLPKIELAIRRSSFLVSHLSDLTTTVRASLSLTTGLL
jgi:hypothetical protein